MTEELLMRLVALIVGIFIGLMIQIIFGDKKE
jgi:hypothetical protein